MAKFDEGAVRFFTPHASGTVGPENSFVFPKSYLDELYKSTGWNIRAVETKLSLPAGYLDQAQAAVIAKPNVRMPSGNEVGAFPGYWVPGGYTSGGVPEAVIPGQLRIDQVAVKAVKELFNGN
ncbi:hypothetical protein [Pseudomonas migulae]|uniref:hypothetical protein n=1 Tax=Pseudomonas migulae TaxID=78543 RepID=UPI0011149099|nr:hypothetical protein [Pseudomonas migulae]